MERAAALDPGILAGGGLIVYQSEHGRLVEAYRHAQDSQRRFEESIVTEFNTAYVLGLWAIQRGGRMGNQPRLDGRRAALVRPRVKLGLKKEIST
jgi:hypothetical protein